jgi:hypothetical protein
MTYGRFFAMIATSTVVMFGLMYLNTYLLSHIFWSETRAYMAVLMGAVMAIIMLAFMFSMYPSRSVNLAIFVASAVIFGGSLWLVRSQSTIGDTSYMRAMIPHHSIAIMTSGRANIVDARVRKMADGIIFAQDKEIAEMRYLINDIDANGITEDLPDPAPAEIVTLSQAMATAEVAILDPEFMTSDDVARLFPEGQACRFSYTPDSHPVLVMGEIDGEEAALFKISGDLVRLAGDNSGGFTADGVQMTLRQVDGSSVATTDGTTTDGVVDAILTMTLDAGLRTGYRGYYRCSTSL